MDDYECIKEPAHAANVRHHSASGFGSQVQDGQTPERRRHLAPVCVRERDLVEFQLPLLSSLHV